MVETGTHPELVAASGHYAEMWSRQREAAITGGSAGGSQLSLASNPSFGTRDPHPHLLPHSTRTNFRVLGPRTPVWRTASLQACAQATTCDCQATCWSWS